MFGRNDTSFPTADDTHDVLGTPLLSGWPEGTETLVVGMGCFWGAERIFWQIPGVVATAVGYMGGDAQEPTYRGVCTGTTGHAEAVQIAYDPAVVSPTTLLKAFWENHDPTTANRQGNDVGTQYRSAVYWTTPGQERAARETATAFQSALDEAGRGAIVTEMRPAADAGPFWPAERYHQQYLAKNPDGYCNHGFKGVTCPVGVANLPAQTDVLPPE